MGEQNSTAQDLNHFVKKRKGKKKEKQKEDRKWCHKLKIKRNVCSEKWTVYTTKHKPSEWLWQWRSFVSGHLHTQQVQSQVGLSPATCVCMDKLASLQCSPSTRQQHTVVLGLHCFLSLNDGHTVCCWSNYHHFQSIRWHFIPLNLPLHCAVGSVSPVGELIRDIFKAINSRQDSRNGIWNGPTGLILLSVYSSIYLKVEGHEIENKTHVNIQYKREKKW